MYEDLIEMTMAEMVKEHNELVLKYKALNYKYESLKDTLRDILEVTNEGY
jgi:hypothetical protein